MGTNLINPLLHIGHYSVHMDQNFDFKIKKDNQKKFYEHRVYESVNDNTLYLRLYLKNRRKKKNSCNKGLMGQKLSNISNFIYHKDPTNEKGDTSFMLHKNFRKFLLCFTCDVI